MIPFRKVSIQCALIVISMSSICTAGSWEEFLVEEQSMFCGVERFESAYETSCMWDKTAQQAGDCAAPQYQEVVGKKPIYKQCKTLFALGALPRLPGSPPVQASASVKNSWNLLRALQPIAFEAVTVPDPVCFSKLKSYPNRTSKADHVFFFDCVNERNELIYRHMSEGNAAHIMNTLQSTMTKANFLDAQTIAAANELAVLLEDEGSKVDLNTVKKIIVNVR